MKKSKIGKLAALLAAGALLFNGFFMSCSSDDDGGDNNGNTGGGTSSNEESIASSISGFEAPSISGSYFPADGATDAYADTDLIIAFDSAPAVSDSAAVTIKSGDTVIDTINAADETLVSGNGNGTIGEIGVRKQLMRVVDNYLIIKTHNDSSAYGLLADSTSYTVSVSGVTGAINKAAVSDISWSFTTKSAPSISGTEISAGHNGTEDFYSVQGALNYVRKNGTAENSYKINVSEGCYYERLFYNGAADITISGDASDADNARGAKTRFYWNNFEGLISGQSGARARAAFFFNGSANVNLRYLTMQNVADRSTDVKSGNAQAEALSADISGKLTAYQCSFASHQDTLYIGAKGNRSWFYDCYIEGDTDYIWGYGDVVLVEKCDLRCIRDSYVSSQKSYIFAARTYDTQEVNKGFVLLNSKVTIDSGVTAYYGRNSGSDTQATVMNNVFTGSGTLASNLWGSSAGTTLDVAGDPAIAYKDYLNYRDSTLVDVSGRLANTFDLGERVAKREYNGRYAILNRGYDKTNEVYATSSNIWDISAYEDEFSASEDTSASNVYVNPVYSKNIVGGNTVQLAASSDASGITYTYSSDDESLATVDGNGLVTTVAEASGTATITVTGSNGSTDTASIKVIPEDIPATAVSVSLADSTVAKYGLTTATVTFEPSDTTDKTYTLTSDNENVLFYDTSSLGLAKSVTTTDETVRIWVGADVSNATITASSTAYESAKSGTAAISASDTVAEWTAEAGSYRMKTDIQSGNVGLWDGLVIDSKADGTILPQNGKMSLKSSDRMQTRNVVLYIPVEGASVISISTTAAPNCTYSVGDGTSQAFEVSDTTQTYTYDGSKTGIVLGSSISSLLFCKSVGDSVSANGKYLKVNVVKTSGDDYITSIIATKTGDFTANWDEQEEEDSKTVTWDWTSNSVTQSSDGASYSTDSITSGYIKGDNDDIVATATGGQFKVSSGYGQLNSGATMQIPVSEGSVLTVTVWNHTFAKNNFILGGKALTDISGDESSDTANYTAEKAGYIALKAVADSSYIKKVSVTGLVSADDFSNDVIDFASESAEIENGSGSLGLAAVAASTTSSDTSVVTVESVSDSVITIKSVSAGTAIITAGDGTNTATISVTVGDYGAITVGTITPYTSSLPDSLYIKYNWESESTGGARVTSGTNCVYGAAYSDEEFSKTLGIEDSYVSAVISGTFNNDKGSYVQPAADSLMQIPVSEGSVVTVSFWDSGASSKFSFAGNTVTAADLTLNLSSKTGNGMSYTATAAGYVELKCLASYYIRYITVSNVLTADVDNHDANVAE